MQSTGSKCYIDYAKEYTSALAHFIAGEANAPFSLEFEELTSPREYNFTTDKIFARISPEQVQWLFNNTDTPVLRQHITDKHSSRDGFISFYPNTLEEWPANVLDWDEIQLGTLLEAYIECLLQGEFDELAIMEDARGNGIIANIIWQNTSDTMQEILNNMEG